MQPGSLESHSVNIVPAGAAFGHSKAGDARMPPNFPGLCDLVASLHAKRCTPNKHRQHLQQELSK